LISWLFFYNTGSWLAQEVQRKWYFCQHLLGNSETSPPRVTQSHLHSHSQSSLVHFPVMSLGPRTSVQG
jgi:hypothetical protein